MDRWSEDNMGPGLDHELVSTPHPQTPMGGYAQWRCKCAKCSSLSPFLKDVTERCSPAY
jgi:hypothetical protein